MERSEELRKAGRFRRITPCDLWRSAVSQVRTRPDRIQKKLLLERGDTVSYYGEVVGPARSLFFES